MLSHITNLRPRTLFQPLSCHGQGSRIGDTHWVQAIIRHGQIHGYNNLNLEFKVSKHNPTSNYPTFAQHWKVAPSTWQHSVPAEHVAQTEQPFSSFLPISSGWDSASSWFRSSSRSCSSSISSPIVLAFALIARELMTSTNLSVSSISVELERLNIAKSRQQFDNLIHSDLLKYLLPELDLIKEVLP